MNSPRNSKDEINKNDLGFGSKISTDRGMNKDGSYNISRIGEKKFRVYEVYHTLITMSWAKFFITILLTYFFANLLFATLYYFIGVDKLTGIGHQLSDLNKFLEAFFFSSQTLTTVGFGRIAPIGNLTSILAAIESMLGVLVFAIATGLLYGRFSRPQAKLLYSKQAIIAPYRDGKALMFRLVNMRRSQLIEVEISVTLAFFAKGAKNRSFERLKLERDKINLFPTSWTIVHPIDEGSPFNNFHLEDLKEMRGEMIILLKAFDDTFSQTIYSRTSYHANELVWGRKFLPMFSVAENGHIILNLALINSTEAAGFPNSKP